MADIYDNNDIKFAICKNINVLLGNVCRIEFVEEAGENVVIKVQGDVVFRHYFDVEKEGNTLFVNIKNPSGSSTHWNAYDRLDFEEKNFVQIFTGCAKDAVNINVINFLDLKAVSSENAEGNYEVRCCKI